MCIYGIYVCIYGIYVCIYMFDVIILYAICYIYICTTVIFGFVGRFDYCINIISQQWHHCMSYCCNICGYSSTGTSSDTAERQSSSKNSLIKNINSL